MNKAIFLDRDGVINSNEGHYYVWKPEDLVINPGVPEALLTLKKRGFLLIVITNQGGISKGACTREDVEGFHQLIQSQLEKHGVRIDAFYYCPHHPEQQNCLCRKPAPLMIQKAMARYRIDPLQSIMVGDAERDLEAARNAGIKGRYLLPSNGNLMQIIPMIQS